MSLLTAGQDDGEYILIKQYVDVDMMGLLFEDTWVLKGIKKRQQQRQRKDQQREREEQQSQGVERLPQTTFYHSQGCRSSSACSYRSSRNSSLRGDEAFDATYQIPSFSRHRKGSGSSYDIDKVSPSLPPPPRRESDQEETQCDVCGKMVNLSRRRDWQ